MSAVSQQVAALRAIRDRVSPQHLVRSGAVARKAEAEHLLKMLADAIETLTSWGDRG